MTPHAYAVFDTETTGLFNKDAPDTAPGQPRMASLSVVLMSPTWATQSEKTFFIKPDGWEMSAEASAINGLSTGWLNKHGVPVREALEYWSDCVRRGRVVCGYSVAFDIRVMRAELERAGMDPLVEQTQTICAMTKCIGVVKLPLDGRRYKVPKLSEALAHFKIPQHGAHTSLGDTISTARLLHSMSRIGIYLEPKPIRARVFKEPKKDLFDDEPITKARQKGKASSRPSWLRPETLE